MHRHDPLIAQGHLIKTGEDFASARTGTTFVQALGVDLADLYKGRRALCKSCLDWSSRRTRFAGSLSTALLDQFYAKGWAKRIEGSRVIHFSPAGEKIY